LVQRDHDARYRQVVFKSSSVSEIRTPVSQRIASNARFRCPVIPRGEHAPTTALTLLGEG
jgi:hypothetical protein